MPRTKEEGEHVPVLEFMEERNVLPAPKEQSVPPELWNKTPDEHYYGELDSDYTREQLDQECELLGGITRDQAITAILNTFLSNKSSRDELQRSYALTEPVAPSQPTPGSSMSVSVGASSRSICPICDSPFRVEQKGQKVCKSPTCGPKFAGYQTDAERNGRVPVAAPVNDPRFSQLESELAELKQMLRQQLRRAA